MKQKLNHVKSNAVTMK